MGVCPGTKKDLLSENCLKGQRGGRPHRGRAPVQECLAQQVRNYILHQNIQLTTMTELSTHFA